ncbi:lipopolysaccharide biosynthesis protein [Mesonia sp. K7]|uniref:lipopolysaccharide biosynthesis protein n=1 Tax=Mesonia sp. K7 TaxID=2218606 RepID=UPI000DA9A0C8|nr:lipopolysaccharide biosynthesis protein [Mesonia sp. K7]PZD76605.1 hypothetical protein DNG35_11480 [Mesonia sp. K7]
MSTLRNKTATALAWDLFGNYGGQISGFIISIFLARLLTPEDFGLVGMSMVFIMVLQIFKDFGFASALIQNKENTSLTYSSVFYINLLAGALLTALLYFAAPLIGDFYENQKIVLIVQLLSITFFINSFNIVQSTILRRTLDFKKLTIRDLISQVIAGMVAVVLAFHEVGVYALVIQQILAAIIQTMLLWKLTDWYPKWEFSFAEVKKLTGFSAYVFAAQSVSQLILQVDTLIIGKLFSPATLGFFSRANSLNTLINKNSSTTLTKVFFPVLASIQDDDQRFQKIFLKVIHLVSVISVFLTGVFYLIGEELIIGLFGEKWEPSITIFKILIIRGFTYPISAIIVNAFLAKGKSKQNFHYGNIRKVLNLSPIIVAFIYGFIPFLYAMLVVSILAWILNIYFTKRSLHIPFIAQIKVVLPNLLFTIGVVFVIEYLFPQEFNYLITIVKAIVFSTLFWIFLRMSKSDVINEFIYYKKKIWKKSKI